MNRPDAGLTPARSSAAWIESAGVTEAVVPVGEGADSTGAASSTVPVNETGVVLPARSAAPPLTAWVPADRPVTAVCTHRSQFTPSTGMATPSTAIELPVL